MAPASPHHSNIKCSRILEQSWHMLSCHLFLSLLVSVDPMSFLCLWVRVLWLRRVESCVKALNGFSPVWTLQPFNPLLLHSAWGEVKDTYSPQISISNIALTSCIERCSSHKFQIILSHFNHADSLGFIVQVWRYSALLTTWQMTVVVIITLSFFFWGLLIVALPPIAEFQPDKGPLVH